MLLCFGMSLFLILTFLCDRVLKLHTPNELLVNNTSITLPHLEKLKLWHSQKVKSAPLSHRRNDTNLNRFSLILLRFALTKCPLLKSLELDDLPFVYSFLINLIG
jgi:hypothetical protein